MDIKIRTRTKVSLIECTRKNLGLYGKSASGPLNFVVAAEGDRVEVLGEYDTQLRAKEILDLIEDQIENALKRGISGIVIQMPDK